MLNKLTLTRLALVPVKQSSTLRYVGVIRFTFSVLHLLPIRFEQQKFNCISESTMKYHQNRIESRTSPYFNYGDKKHMFVDSLTEYIGAPNSPLLRLQ